LTIAATQKQVLKQRLDDSYEKKVFEPAVADGYDAKVSF